MRRTFLYAVVTPPRTIQQETVRGVVYVEFEPLACLEADTMY